MSGRETASRQRTPDGRKSILVTGALGSLGRGVVEQLSGRFRVISSDVTPQADRVDYFQADLRDAQAARRLVAAEHAAIVHTPAWHGVHANRKMPIEYWQLNVDGTFNVLNAAAEAGVKRVVWASSLAFYGPSAEPYPFSKQVGESVLDHFRDRAEIQSVRLRFSNFTPHRDFIEYGTRFLGGGLDRRDAIEATVVALDQLLAGAICDSAYDIVATSPFSTEDADQWRTDPWAVLQRHYPDHIGLLRSYLADRLPAHLRSAGNGDAGSGALGFVPRFNFDSFVGELAERVGRNDLSAPAGYSVAR